jgi:hypothetical protein
MILQTKNDKEINLDEHHHSIAKSYSWRSKKTGRGDYEKIYTYIDGKMINFNKIVFGLTENQCMIFKNGNCFDYTQDNVLILLKSELAHIKGSSSRTKSSKYHGVYFCNSTQKWWVRVNKNEKAGSENCYDLEEEAAIVSDYIAISKYQGAASRNFPELSFDEIKEKYHNIKEKYGHTKSERWAKVMQGTSRCKSKASKYVGVNENKKRKKKWCARIKFNKKYIYLGNYEIEEAAARAYDKKALELYGEFAKLNFPNN